MEQEINPQLVKRLSQRLFFVVNKADVMHSAEGMDETETKEYVAGLITRTLQQEGFQLEPDQASPYHISTIVDVYLD